MYLGNKLKHYQAGISLIAAIFMLVGLSILGALMTTLITAQTESTLNEWQSIKALYAVESGVQASAYLINQSAVPGGNANCDAADAASAVQVDSAVDAWYTIESTADTITGVNVCRIVATGMAGGSSSNPVSQREFNVIYSAIVNQ